MEQQQWAPVDYNPVTGDLPDLVETSILAKVVASGSVATPANLTGKLDVTAAAATYATRLQQKYARYGHRRYARSVGNDVMTSPPTITQNTGGLASNNYDTTVCRYNAPVTAGVSGNTATLNPDTNKGNPSGNGPVKVRMLGGVPQIATHAFQQTISSALAEAIPGGVNRYAYEIGHGGAKIALGFTPYGGGDYGGNVRVKINGQYATYTPLLFKGSAFAWVIIDFGGVVSRRNIVIESQLSPLAAIDVGVNDFLFLPSREAAPLNYIVADSFGDGANGTDGGVWTGLAPQVGRALSGENNIIDSLGGTGLLKVNGGSANYLTRLQTTLPILAAAGMLPNLIIIIGSVNDTSFTQAQLTAQATLIYQLCNQYGIPVYHVVMAGSGGQSGMATTLAGYQAAAATYPNVLGVLDLTNALTGTGYAPAPAPTLNDYSLTTATGPAAGQYGYVWTALVGANETTPSAEQVVTVPTGQAPKLSIRQVGGATGFSLYRRPMDGVGNATGPYVRIVNNNPSKIQTDTGTAGTANLPPATNNTGNLQPGTNSVLRSVDGTHPTQLGHDLYAELIMGGLDTVLLGLAA